MSDRGPDTRPLVQREPAIRNALLAWSEPFPPERSAIARRWLELDPLPQLPGRVVGLEPRGLRMRVDRGAWHASGQLTKGRGVVVDGTYIAEIVAFDPRVRGADLNPVVGLGGAAGIQRLDPNDGVRDPAPTIDLWLQIGLPVRIAGRQFDLVHRRGIGLVLKASGVFEGLPEGATAAEFLGVPVELRLGSWLRGWNSDLQRVDRDPTPERWRAGIALDVTD